MPATLPNPAWVATLRDALRHEHGSGWSVAPQHGRVRLTRRDLSGTRSTVTLPITWERSCVSAVIAHVAALREQIDERGASLAAAAELLPSAPPSGPIDWPALVGDYLTTRSDLRSTTRRDLVTRLERMLATLSTRPTPRDGPELFAGLRAAALRRMPSRGPGPQAAAAGCDPLPPLGG